MNRFRSDKAIAAVVEVAVLLLLCVSPASAQGGNTTTPAATTGGPGSYTDLTRGSEFENKPYNSDTYAGMGKDINVRKDAWNWYWSEKAHVDIDTENKSGFWGNDGVSLFFKGIADNVVVPFWNGAMQYDFIRVGFLLILAGMLLGFGASLVMPKKDQK